MLTFRAKLSQVAYKRQLAAYTEETRKHFPGTPCFQMISSSCSVSRSTVIVMFTHPPAIHSLPIHQNYPWALCLPPCHLKFNSCLWWSKPSVHGNVFSAGGKYFENWTLLAVIKLPWLPVVQSPSYLHDRRWIQQDMDWVSTREESLLLPLSASAMAAGM